MKIIQFSIKLILKQIPQSIPLNMSRNKVDLSNLRKQVIGKGKATDSTEVITVNLFLTYQFTTIFI